MNAASLTDFKDCCIPNVPLAQFDEEIMEGSSSASNQQRKCKMQQNREIMDDDSKSSSTTTSNNLSTSLQELVESFDKNVNIVLKDMNRNAEQIAPVKIRSQEEIMSESQFWWTLTGNYGNLPPIDFDQSHIRRKQLASLDLQMPNTNNDERATTTDPSLSGTDDEEEKAHLDFHRAAAVQAQLTGNGETPPVSADRVIEEIDEILQAGDFMHESLATQRTLESFDSMYSSMRSPNTAYPDADSEFDLKQNDMSQYSQSKLLTIVHEMEQIIQLYNELLVRELARRDEFEYEKEVRNHFITLLITVQEHRRKAAAAGKRQRQDTESSSSTIGQQSNNNNLASVIIPFDDSQEVPDVRVLEPLVKILQAMTDDSAQLPSLLTDYILNVICPNNPTSAFSGQQ